MEMQKTFTAIILTEADCLRVRLQNARFIMAYPYRRCIAEAGPNEGEKLLRLKVRGHGALVPNVTWAWKLSVLLGYLVGENSDFLTRFYTW
jgi:hypothetical protein